MVGCLKKSDTAKVTRSSFHSSVDFFHEVHVQVNILTNYFNVLNPVSVLDWHQSHR